MLATFIYVVLRFAVRYRRKLILAQLSKAFPEKSERSVARFVTSFIVIWQR